MKKGKDICNTLKQIRLDVARANGIDYNPTPCNHEGDCAGTCPACESEVRYIEREIARKRGLGKAALVAGVSLGLAFASSSCTGCNTQVVGLMPNDDEVTVLDSLDNVIQDSVEVMDTVVDPGSKDTKREPLQGMLKSKTPEEYKSQSHNRKNGKH